MGEWYLHMFGITLAGDWWPIAVLPVLFGPGGVVLWILGGVFNNRPWIVAIANVLVLQFIISALGASIGHFAMFLTFGPHVPGLTDSTTGRAAEQLYVSSSPQTWIPGLITAGIALTLAVIMAAVTGASSARQNGTAMNRLRIIAYVLSCLGFVALLIAMHSACISAQQADQHPAGGIGVPDADRMDSRRNEVDTPLRRGTT